VAVKCLANDKLKAEMGKFLLEAANMCSVDHEHIVQLYGVVLGSDSLMLVTLFIICLLFFSVSQSNFGIVSRANHRLNGSCVTH